MQRRPIVLVIAAVSAGVVLAGCGSSSGAGGHGGHPTASSAMHGQPPENTAKQGDIAFAQQMIPHHRQAIEMADIALAKSSASQNVRALATSIRREQAPEIKTMTGWLTSWGVSTDDPKMSEMTGMSGDSATSTDDPQSTHSGHSMGGMMTPAEMKSLRKANGPTFDTQWLTMMIKHHQGAVQMSTDVLHTTDNAQVRTLAKSIVRGQNAEITRMRGYLGSA